VTEILPNCSPCPGRKTLANGACFGKEMLCEFPTHGQDLVMFLSSKLLLHFFTERSIYQAWSRLANELSQQIFLKLNNPKSVS
jgi:hypothetical protein